MSSSPRITHMEWGRMEVEGLGCGRDLKLWPGGGRAWDWREAGTRHDPGIQPGDVTELLEQGAEVVVLSGGMELRLGCCESTRAHLRERGVAFHVAETREAMRIYNELVDQGQRVGGLFHTTC